MLDTNSIIKCPDCNSEIHINTYQLLMGTSFTCGNCQLMVGLAGESKTAVSKALTELENVKSKK